MASSTKSASSLDGASIEQLLEQARELLKSLRHPARLDVLGPKSVALYRKEHDKLYAAKQRGIEMVDAIQQGTSRSMFLLRRNAVRHFERLALEAALEQIEARQPINDSGPESHLVIESIAWSVQWLAACQAVPRFERQARPGPSHRLRLLPAFWQETLLSRASPALRPALRIMTLTGCRPEELRRGIRVRIRPSNDPVALELVIQNAKNGLPDGPATRTYCFNRGTDHVDALISELLGSPLWPKSDLFDRDELAYHAAGVSQRVADLVTQIWPGRKYRPHAYSYRYAFRLRLKVLGFIDTEIAAALGHSSVRTQTVYGRGYSHGSATDRSFLISGSIAVPSDQHRAHGRQRFLDRVRDRERELEIDRDREGPEIER